MASDHAATGTETPIKHVIIVTMENHSFDNIFGIYPYGGNSKWLYLQNQITMPDDLNSASHPSGLEAVPPASFSTPDPIEGYTAYHLDWNGGKMNGFVTGSGPQSMTYFTAAQMAPEWVLAQEFSIGDMYFASALTATIPNRLYQIAGYSPVMNDYGLPPYIPFSETVFGELSNYGISWAYYVKNTADNSLIPPFIQGFPYSKHLQNWNQFADEITSGTLPSVSYFGVIGGGASGYSQHPSDNVLAGEMLLLYIVDSVMKSPLWNSTAIFITYDEGGGYYDHVPPPVVDGQQFGFRVPLIVVSPYAKEDYVSNTLMNQASLISFIDYNWKILPLNSLVAHSNIPLDMFYFAEARPPFPLNASAGFPVPSGIDFSPASAPDSPQTSLFPYSFQIPVQSLPYNRTGSSSFNLSSVNDAVFVEHDTAYTPVFMSVPFLLILTALVLAASYIAVSRRR